MSRPDDYDPPPVPADAPVAAKLERVTKRFGDRCAVRDLTLAIRAGEVFAFLGPNGAGKTTTMRMTIGLLRPDEGTIEVCGFSMADQARLAKRHVAYVPDQPFLYDKLTGREFIEFTREMYGVRSDVAAARLAALARRLDMNGFLDQLCEHYSHGMKQKTALAAAMIHAPRLLVVDEPMVGLDPRTVHVTKAIFRELAAAGAAVFMSTHTLDVAESVADRIGIIHEGRLVALGTLSQLRASQRTDTRLEEIFLKLTESSDGAAADPVV